MDAKEFCEEFIAAAKGQTFEMERLKPRKANRYADKLFVIGARKARHQKKRFFRLRWWAKNDG